VFLANILSMANEDYEIILFYKYVHIDDPEAVAMLERARCASLGLTGRCIIAGEGINATYEGTKENVEKYITELECDTRFQNIQIKRSVGTGDAFPKLSVKAREEIVSLNLGMCDINPNETTGKHLKPEELHEWLAPTCPEPRRGSKVEGIKDKKEFYIVDMRNAYEHKVGYFEGSILPPMENFRDLPKLVKQIAHLKDKTVLTVCTGGVRCEKASGFLITQGFKDVYQLDGGIVSYMERYPNEDFKGKLYVFDGRVTMSFQADDPKHQIVASCDSCGEQSENYVNCANPVCHRHFIACKKCVKSQRGIFCPGGCKVSRHGRSLTWTQTKFAKLRHIWYNHILSA
jgi:UPF0176 protein